MKKCTKCNEEKPFSEFQKRKASKDGMTAACKKCLSEYDKSRAMLAHRVKAREEYRKTDAFKKSRYKTTKKYRAKNPNKTKAHRKVQYEVSIGSLSSKPCEICGTPKTVAHHDDYSKPLDIRWLCAKHHKQWHAENGEGLNPF